MDQNPAQPSAFDQTVALYQQGKIQEALAAAKRGLAVRPEDGELLNLAGAAAHQLGFVAAAEQYFRKAIGVQPGLVDAHNNFGNLLMECDRLEEAEAAYRRVLDLNPGCAKASYNLGNLLTKCDRPEEAEATYQRALATRPDHAPTHNNLGNLLMKYGRLAEAEAAYRQALALCPEHAEARFNYALLLLATGRFTEGWSLYEARYDSTNGRRAIQHLPPFILFPQWQGESITGKSLLVIGEQGCGDQIQFVRYIGELKRRGASRVDMAARDDLTALFATVDGVDTVYTSRTAIQAKVCDYWTFLLSIPLHCKTTPATIPAALPYLRALPERVEFWRRRLPCGELRVGLVWRGNAEHVNDAHRSLPGLPTLAPLWAVPGVTFISLQKGAGEDEAAAPPAGQPLVHLGSAVRDFTDTAAIVSLLDLVICVDTAIAHLAGALGKPCWVLLPHLGIDWRWLPERTDSPWYPGVLRLFRQTTPGDWAAVAREVAHGLRDYAMRR